MLPTEREAWRQADRILEQILDLPPAQRAQRLASLAPDAQLRQCVERLLAAHAGASGPLEQPIPIALLPDVHHALSGRRLGRWRLLEEIGRGGMAVVYRAIADEGDAAGQQAALKVLSIGTLASDGRERFVHEQQALLRLRHPYLAQLYDTGVAEDGTPWLAMALVEGERIDVWCEQRGLGVAARVRLVVQVCGALAYAHRNLVIHRDIKPSNVLVDHDGHVRLLDFGIARLADHAGDERTATAMRALTPEYAAPEQFAGALPSTTMDVYGLGALLYRLLAERPPRPRSGLEAGPPTERPSRAVQAAVHIPPPERRQRVQRLRGDLDTVVMKALADKPENRYPGVEALAEDLRRWLAQRPILAHPPSRRYRFGKFVARHRLGVAAAAMLSLALVAGIAGTLWQARLAQQQAVQAQAAQARSERALARSNAIRDFLFELFRNTAPSTPREQLPTTAELLTAAIDQVPERFKQDADTQAEFMAAIAEVYYQRDMPEHLPLRRRVLQLRSQSRQRQPLMYAAAQANLAQSLAYTDRPQSSRLFAEAIATIARLAPGSRELAYAYRQRTTLHMHRQDGPARLRDSERAWLILEKLPGTSARERFFAVANVAAGYHQAGEYLQALRHYDKAVALAEEAFGGKHMFAVVNFSNRAGVLSHLGRFAEAEADNRTSLANYGAILEKPRDYMLVGLRELERIYYRQGRYADALLARDEWDLMLRDVAPDNLHEQAKSRLWRALTLLRLHRTGEAQALLAASLPLLDKTDPHGRNRLMGYSAQLRIACDRPVPSAVPAADLDRALSLAQRMHGDNIVYAAEAHALTGLCALRNGHAAQALASLDRARLLDADLPPGDVAEVAEHLLWRGEALAGLGDAAGARAARSEARRRMRVAGLEAHPLNAALQVAER